MSSLKWNEIAEHLFLFERNNAKKLGEIQVEDFCAWGIIKIPFFYSLVRHNSEKTITAKTNTGFNKIRRIFRVCRALIDLLKVTLKSKRNPVLFHAFSGDKLSRNSAGEYFNFLLDGFITSGVVSNYVYAERSLDGDYRKPSPGSIDIKIDVFNELLFFYRKPVNKIRGLQKSATEMAKLVNDYFQPYNISISVQDINEIIVSFFAGYKAYGLLLRCSKPSLIISSEQLGSAMLAAANKRKIQSIDLQHGLIDEYYPLYQYSSGMKEFQDKLILPSFIGVFGNFHKKILLKNNFWSADQMRVLGSVRMEEIRKNFGGPIDDKEFRILLPTQWTVFEETKVLLALLSEKKHLGYKLLIKPHPLEPVTNGEFYISFQKENSQWVEFADSQTDIYSLIKSSKVILGFDSTTLLEGLCLGIPCITIGLDNVPDGIHSLLGTDAYREVIKCVGLREADKLFSILEKTKAEPEYYDVWRNNAFDAGKDFYATNYYENIREFILASNNSYN